MLQVEAMGWLRDLMLDAEIRSFGALARAALSHHAWPAQSKAQTRSLAAMLSRFDRGMELDWLSERPIVQQVLSELLQCPVSDLRAPLQRPEHEHLSPARMRLEGLPGARSLEFSEEPLPPGLPPDLTVPSSWDRLLWTTLPGAGRTIAKQWLDIRGRAEVRTIRECSSLAQLPTFGPPLFIDAGTDVQEGPLPDWTPSRPICLAIDKRASNLSLWEQAGWSIVECPAIEASLDSIVVWVAQRLSPQAHFNAEAVAGWLREGPLGAGLIETLGDVLGWCGLVTAIGLEATRRRDKKQILSLCVKRALAPLAERRDARSSGLSRKAPDLLVAMAERSLLLAGQDWLMPRTLEGWVELLPNEERLGPDVDWMRVHLATASKAIRVRDVERAAARFPPGAHRWMGLLRDAGLLRPIDETSFVLRPHFLARLVLANAKASLMQASSAVWGGALYQSDATASVWPQLLERAENTPESLIDAVLEDLDEESPSSVLALDATVIALGLSLLNGHELSPALVEPLLDEACALALQRQDESPRPRLTPTSPIRGIDAHTLWWLCMLGLGENLAGKRRSYDKRLVPWQQREPPEALRQLFDDLLAQLQTLPRPLPSWVPGTFAMLERLRQALGAVKSADSRPHTLHIPGIALDEVMHGVLEPGTLQRLIGDVLLFLAFEALANQRQCSEETWAESFWQALADSDLDVTARGFVARHAQRLIPHVPPELGVAWLEDLSPIEAMLPLLPHSVFATWLDRRDPGSGALPPDVVRSLPEELLERLLVDLEPGDEASLPVIWDRAPERVIARLHRFRVMLPERAARWLDCAPVAAAGLLFRAAEMDDWLKASAPLLLALRRYCRRCIDTHSTDWQVAYGWLVKLERVLKR
jgi:hypothetical protein